MYGKSEICLIMNLRLVSTNQPGLNGVFYIPTGCAQCKLFNITSMVYSLPVPVIRTAGKTPTLSITKNIIINRPIISDYKYCLIIKYF